MSAVTVEIRREIEKKVRALALAEGLSLEAYISMGLERQVAARDLHEMVQAKRGRVSARRFRALLAKAPEVPPVPGDELPPGFRMPRRKRRTR